MMTMSCYELLRAVCSCSMIGRIAFEFHNAIHAKSKSALYGKLDSMSLGEPREVSTSWVQRMLAQKRPAYMLHRCTRWKQVEGDNSVSTANTSLEDSQAVVMREARSAIIPDQCSQAPS